MTSTPEPGKGADLGVDELSPSAAEKARDDLLDTIRRAKAEAAEQSEEVSRLRTYAIIEQAHLWADLSALVESPVLAITGDCTEACGIARRLIENIARVGPVPILALPTGIALGGVYHAVLELAGTPTNDGTELPDEARREMDESFRASTGVGFADVQARMRQRHSALVEHLAASGMKPSWVDD